MHLGGWRIGICADGHSRAELAAWHSASDRYVAIARLHTLLLWAAAFGFGLGLGVGFAA